MRVLFVNTSMPPVPYGTGHQVHNWGNIQALQLLGHEVFLVMLSRYGEDSETKIKEANHANENLKLCTAIELPEQRNKSLNSLSIPLILKELSKPFLGKVPYFIQNHQFVCSELERLITDIKAELIWYEDFYVAVFDNWINRNIPAIYNSHDNQAKLYKQKNLNRNDYSKRFGSKIRRLIHKNRHNILEKSEFITQRRCNLMFTGNSDDAVLSQSRGVKAILRKVPIIGANEELLNKRKNHINNKIKKSKLKLVHLGFLNGGFTAKSLIWFLDNIWPSLLRESKDINVELHIIGGGKPSEELLNKFAQPDIIYRGYVEDLWKEFVDTFAMLIPGQVSTGIRIRVPVAFSMMVPVIGNKVSFHGMPDAKDGKTVLYAENAVEYSSAIRSFIESTSVYEAMCKDVRRAYEDSFSIKAASVQIQQAISTLK